MFRPRLRAPSALGGSITNIANRRAAQGALAPLSQPLVTRRSIHRMPVSRHDVRVGVPQLLSAEGFDLAWTQHMTLTLNRLNQLVTGTDYEDRDLKNIVLDTARVPHLANVFNHASMAHNTDFFFKMLLPGQESDVSAAPGTGGSPAAGPREIPASLRTAIEESFGSVDTLRREFSAIAQGMFGPGFIWLVKANTLNQASGRGGESLRLLNTYLAGSPYPGAHWRRQTVDMNTVGAEAEGESASAADPAQQWLDSQARASGIRSPGMPAPAVVPHTQQDRRPPGGLEVIPILCLSTWEHVWLRDYGLGADGYGGKAAYVEAWWDAVDWDAVVELANLNRLKLKT